MADHKDHSKVKTTPKVPLKRKSNIRVNQTRFRKSSGINRLSIRSRGRR